MKDVGLKLAEKRKSLKLSYEEVSNITKLPIGTIKAIEAGDLDYFQNDLSYVRFYVRSYCKALDVPYEHFKDDVLDSVEEYTTTMSMHTLKEHENIETQITQKAAAIKSDIPVDKGPKLAHKDRSSIASNAQQSSRFRKAKKIDFAFLSLMVVIAIVAVIVIYVAFSALLNNDNDTTPTDNKIEDVEKTPKPEKEQKEKEDNNKNEESAVRFEQNAVNAYTVSGIKANEAIKIEITFKNAGSFNLWKGNTSFTGAYGVYEAGATYTYESTVTANEVLTFNFWNYGGAEIKVNGTPLTYDEAAQRADNGVTYFRLTTKGE